MEPHTAQGRGPQQGASLLAQELRSKVAPVRVEAGETVVRQGDQGRGFYLVASGSLDVILASEEGLRLPVARLGPGSHFGEMSLLTGAPASADVIASEPTTLYAASPEEFRQLIEDKPDVLRRLVDELALRLKGTNEQLAAQQERQATLSKLVGSRPMSPFKDDLPSAGGRMAKAIAEAAASDRPVLIAGEKGVGKKALALQIHATGPRRDKAVLVLDCRELPRGEARSQLFGDEGPEFVTRFSDRLGYLQAADRGTLILADIDRLPAEVQEDLAVFLRTHAGPATDSRVAVRVIGTWDPALEGSDEQSTLCDTLSQAFAGGPTIHVRPLRERRRDIIPLAEHFLAQAAQRGDEPPKRLDDSARRTLLSYDYRLDNCEELRQVVNLGMDLTEGEAIGAEHLFFGAGIGIDTPQVDLLRWTWFERLLRRRNPLAEVKLLVGFIFAAIVATCLILPHSRLGQVTNVMVWGLWWPALIILSVVLGRVWCSVCPLSTGAEAVQRVGGRGWAPPDRLKNIGPVVALVGFAAIIWVEHAAGMSTRPQATAVLLLGLSAIAAAVGWLFQRHTWCRYLCPLGAMCSVFSTAAILRVHARREVCLASCAGNECYRGSEHVQGCPMFNHAMFLNNNQHCKLCLDCLRACPVSSPRLVIQLPLRDIWHPGLVSAEAAPLTAVVGLMALLLAAAPLIDAQPFLDGWWFTLGTLAVVAVGLVVRRALRSLDESEGGLGLSWVARVAFAYAPAVAGALLAFHLLSLPWLDEISLRIDWARSGPLQTSLLPVMQRLALGIGGLMTLWSIWRLSRQRFRAALLGSAAIFASLGGLAVAYVAAAVALLSPA